MKRPVLIGTIGIIIGIILGLYFKIGIALVFSLLLIKKLKKSISILLIATSIISFINISYCETQYQTKYSNEQKIKGQAIVISDAEKKQYYNVCTIRYNGDNLILHTNSNLNYGDLIEIEGEFVFPNSQRNYGGFDYREYLKTKKIYGIVTSKKVKILANEQLDRISMFSNLVQNKIKANIKEIDSEETGGLLIGILLGDKNSISDEIQTDFKNSGLAHLLAVSGLHVNYVVMAVIFALNKIRMNKRLACSVTIIFLIFFMYITNFTESVMRAGIMGIVMLGAQIFYRKQDTATSIALSLMIILLENPYKLFSVGLQLSYAGTIGIVYFYPKLKEKMNDIIAVCISAQILITPIMLIHFNMFSTHFLLANILASPIAGIVIISGFVFVLVSFISLKLSMVIYIPLKLLLRLLILINHIVSNLPFSTILVKTPYWFNIVFFYIAIFFKEIWKACGFNEKFDTRIFGYNFRVNYKKVLILILIILILITLFLDNFHSFTIYFVDVGQGDCTLIRTSSNKTILIDGGGSENYDVGKNVLVPYLLDRRITKIDYMIISHFDTDHVRRLTNCNGATRCRPCYYFETGKGFRKL